MRSAWAMFSSHPGEHVGGGLQRHALRRRLRYRFSSTSWRWATAFCPNSATRCPELGDCHLIPSFASSSSSLLNPFDSFHTADRPRRSGRTPPGPSSATSPGPSYRRVRTGPDKPPPPEVAARCRRRSLAAALRATSLLVHARVRPRRSFSGWNSSVTPIALDHGDRDLLGLLVRGEALPAGDTFAASPHRILPLDVSRINDPSIGQSAERTIHRPRPRSTRSPGGSLARLPFDESPGP